MDLIEHPGDVPSRIRHLRMSGRSVGLVPTMGALHAGHGSLMQAARRSCDVVITTIFVNPLQFAPGEDLDKYPRDLPADLELCRAAGVDLVFAPSAKAMYPADGHTTVAVSGLTSVLEGASRPTHFDGVTTVVAKLFHITQPDRAFFGQKDYQQQLVIRRMVTDLNWPIEIVTCPIVRESDGVAMSSRNRYLSSEHRERARILNETLRQAEWQAAAGTVTPLQVEAWMQGYLAGATDVEVDYAVVADPESLKPVAPSASTAVALLAVRIGSTRLIDNAVLTFAERP